MLRVSVAYAAERCLSVGQSLWQYSVETPPSEYCHEVWYGKKLECCRYRRRKKIENMFTRFDIIHECARHQTDGRTDTHDII